MDTGIIAGIHNNEERKVSENSFLCSLTTILAMPRGERTIQPGRGEGE